MFKPIAVLAVTGVALMLALPARSAECAEGVVLPASFRPGQPVPLVIGLHPSGGSGAAFDQDTGLGTAATARGFAVLFPDGGVARKTPDGGTAHYWNIPGVPLVTGPVPADARDDVRFIADAIDRAVKLGCVNPRRVYVTGFSGGARMSSMVGCRLADRVTAVAPVAGLRAGRAAGAGFSEPDAGDCRPQRPLRVLAIHGTADATNPFPGGGGLRWGYSVERAAARWASLDNCSGRPAVESVAPHVTLVRYAACGGDSEVALYRIEAPQAEGGGHVWPGGKRDLATRSPPAYLDATQLVLQFFAEQPPGARPDPAAPMYQRTGEQYRIYDFPGTGEPIPYRLFVPESWTPDKKLPVLVTLRAGNSINNNHRGGNELVEVARERGYIVISPLGYRGYTQPYYGSPYPVDREDGPSVPARGWTPQDDQRAEQDVLNVLNVVAAEYKADTSRFFLHGQNPSGSAAFHFAAKYPGLFRALVVSAGPIITTNYPFEKLKGTTSVLMLAGDKDAKYTAAACERMTKELKAHGVEAEFHLVPNGEHLNAYLLYAPQLFDFLDKHH